MQLIASKVDALEVNNSELEVQLKSSQEVSKLDAAAKIAMQKSLAEMEVQYSALQSKNASTEDSKAIQLILSERTLEVAAQKAMIEDLEHDCSELQNRLKKSLDDASMLKNEWKHSESRAEATEKALGAELLLAKEEIANGKARSDELDATIIELETMKVAKKEAESRACELESTMEEIHALKTTLVEVKLRADDAESSLAKMNGIREAMSNAEAKILELETNMKELDVLRDAKAEAEERASSAERYLNGLKEHGKQRLAAAEETISTITEKCSNLEAQIESLASSEAQLTSFNEKCEHLEAEVNSKNEALSSKEEQLATLTEKCEQLEAEIESKDDALAETENELFQLRQEMEASAFTSTSELDLKAHQRELDEKDLRIAHLEKSKLTKDQLEKIKQVKEDRARLAAENKELKKQCENFKLKSTNVDADTSKEQIAELENRISVYKDAARTSRKEISDLTALVNKLKVKTGSEESTSSDDVPDQTSMETTKVKTPARVPMSERKASASKQIASSSKQIVQDENDPRVNKPTGISANEKDGECTQQ
jgi:chromosome segregation ATPase